MTIYLTIITTALVLTQIIRCVQNAVQLRRQNILFKKQLGELANTEVTKEDFEMQRKAYRLIVENFERKAENETFCAETEVGGAENGEERVLR